MFISDGTGATNAPYKDPDSIIDYGCNWSGWLRDGETITSSEWLVLDEVGGLVVESESFSSTSTTAFISGGKAPSQYTLTNRVTTSLGVREDRSMKITIREK